MAGLCGAIFAAILTAAVSTQLQLSSDLHLRGHHPRRAREHRRSRSSARSSSTASFEFLEPQNDHPDVKRWLFYGAIVLLDRADEAVVQGRGRPRRDGRVRLRRRTPIVAATAAPRGRPARRSTRAARVAGSRTGSSSRMARPRELQQLSSTSGSSSRDRARAQPHRLVADHRPRSRRSISPPSCGRTCSRRTRP